MQVGCPKSATSGRPGARDDTGEELLPENRSHGTRTLPTINVMNTKRFTEREDEFWRALERRDASYEGIFFVGVKTTGIFCRPICSARKPLRKNVEFFPGKSEALHAGFRPCLRS